jgi:hypothetical protein
VQIDGIRISEHLVLVAALGIDSEGFTHPLGLMEGATEHSAVVQALIDDLIERGLAASVHHRRLEGARQAASPQINHGLRKRPQPRDEARRGHAVAAWSLPPGARAMPSIIQTILVQRSYHFAGIEIDKQDSLMIRPGVRAVLLGSAIHTPPLWATLFRKAELSHGRFKGARCARIASGDQSP